MKLLCLVITIFIFTSCFNNSELRTNNDSSLTVERNPTRVNYETTSSPTSRNNSSNESLEQRIARYTEEIRKNPNNADLYFRRGYLYAYLHDFPMDDLIKEAIIGLFNSRSEEWNLAITDWERALRINPNHANAKKYLEYAR